MTWALRSLAEVADFELGKMLDQVKNKGEPRPYLANVNVRWGEFDLADLREMRFGAHELERFSIRHGDIVMCEGGEPGRCARWTMPLEGVMFQKALHRIRPRAGLDSSFLYYQFLCIGRTGGFAPYFTGATIKHLPREQLAKVPIRVPELRVQHAIAAVLEPYDDLMAVNQRRIALLEDTARRLYREWFVSLRFPGHELVPLTDELPEGWRRMSLGELCDRTPGASVQTGPFGSQLHQSDYKPTGVPVVMPQDIVADRIRHDRIAHVDESTASRLSRHELRAMDIVFPRRGDISKRALVEQHQAGFLCGTGCLKISLPQQPLHPLVLYFQLADPEMVKWIEGQAVGATMLNLSASIMRTVSCLVPKYSVQQEFVETVGRLRAQIDALGAQVEALSKARDLLLPKLMSGKLDVSSIRLPEEATT